MKSGKKPTNSSQSARSKPLTHKAQGKPCITSAAKLGPLKTQKLRLSTKSKKISSKKRQLAVSMPFEASKIFCPLFLKCSFSHAAMPCAESAKTKYSQFSASSMLTKFGKSFLCGEVMRQVCFCEKAKCKPCPHFPAPITAMLIVLLLLCEFFIIYVFS